MRNIFLLLICLVSFGSFSQMTMTHEGATINNGDVFLHNSIVYPASEWKFKIFNTSSDVSIFVKGQIVSVTNAPGSDVQFCIGPVCVNNIIVGNSYPTVAFEIEAGGENSNFDHFRNDHLGINTTANVDYVIRFYQVNEANVEIGTPISVTYRYNANLSNSEFNSIENTGLQLQSTLVSSTLDYKATLSGTITIIDVNGKIVNTTSITEGDGSIEVSNLTSGIYFINYLNSNGSAAAAKFVKK